MAAALGLQQFRAAMSWDPLVLRKFNATGHFRLLNQVRSELRSNPLVRPQEGQTIGEVNRSRALIRATEGRGSGSGSGRSRRGGQRESSAGSATTPQNRSRRQPAPAVEPSLQDHGPFTVVPLLAPEDGHDDDQSAISFRDRLTAVELR
jgi:hypothetical protein